MMNKHNNKDICSSMLMSVHGVPV